jgi:Fe(3+) dicitrate transport protein
LTKNFYLTPGYRFEHIATQVSGYYNDYSINNANDTLQTIQSNNNSSNIRNIHLLGTGITYNSHKYGKFILNGSQNFRSVNFSDINILLRNFRVDDNIEDKKGFTADISYNKSWNGKAYIGVTGYYLHYANRIGVIWKTDDATFDTYQFRTNVSSSRTIGSEITSWIDFAKITSMNDSTQKLNLLTNITINNAKYTDESTIVYGNWVEMVPALTIKSSLTYEYKNWLISGLVNFQTQQYSEATNALESNNGLYGTIPSFYVVDAKVGYEYKKFTFEASINNLTDVKYFTQRANSYPGPGIIPSEGRTFFGSVIFKI